jgi:circadian clock protein KaiC
MKRNEFRGLKPPKKIETGIEGLDYITLGGLTEGRTSLVAGSSGSGKTLLGVEFLYRGITQYNRPGIFITFEERPRDIVRNVKTLGWELDQLIAQNKFRFIDASPDPIPQEESGGYDLSGLFSRIEYSIKATGAKILVMDSIGSLFHQFNRESIIRREISRITDLLAEYGLTAIMTAERLAEYGLISRLGIEEFVSDNVIILRNILEKERCRRTIQILKMRGRDHFKGEFPFSISNTGFSILPLSAIELKQPSSSDRISVGNDELNKMTGGGIFKDSIFLVSGPTGSGKTLMAATFAAEACKHSERILLIAYEESKEELLRDARAWGMDFLEWENQGFLKIICQYPEKMGLEEHLLTIRREIAAFKPQRLVLDSISALERTFLMTNFREFNIGLTSYLKCEGICSLFTSTASQLSGDQLATQTHILTISDIIMLLRYVEINGALRRGAAIIKMRGSQHEKQVFEFIIDSKGMHVGAPFKNIENIILGTPTLTGRSETNEPEGMFDR